MGNPLNEAEEIINKNKKRISAGGGFGLAVKINAIEAKAAADGKELPQADKLELQLAQQILAAG